MSSATDHWLRPHAQQRALEADAPGAGLQIGVLALQGAFAEHAVALQRLGCGVTFVRRPEHLEGLTAIVMPGGESTTMAKLAVSSGLKGALGERLKAGFPAFGTCAGLILLGTEVLDGRDDQWCFAAIDVAVRRNGYGRQIDSFEVSIDASLLATERGGKYGTEPIEAVFIRAPRIEKVGEGVDVLAITGETPVIVRQNNVLGCAFHPEMTAELRVHRYFIEQIVRKSLLT